MQGQSILLLAVVRLPVVLIDFAIANSLCAPGIHIHPSHPIQRRQFRGCSLRARFVANI